MDWRGVSAWSLYPCRSREHTINCCAYLLAYGKHVRATSLITCSSAVLTEHEFAYAVLESFNHIGPISKHPIITCPLAPSLQLASIVARVSHDMIGDWHMANERKTRAVSEVVRCQLETTSYQGCRIAFDVFDGDGDYGHGRDEALPITMINSTKCLARNFWYAFRNSLESDRQNGNSTSIVLLVSLHVPGGSAMSNECMKRSQRIPKQGAAHKQGSAGG